MVRAETEEEEKKHNGGGLNIYDERKLVEQIKQKRGGRRNTKEKKLNDIARDWKNYSY